MPSHPLLLGHVHSAQEADGYEELTFQQAVDLAAHAARGARTVLIDGASGCGKTTFAQALARRLGFLLIHLDSFYPGWEGLAKGSAMVAETVLREDNPGFESWDWRRNAAGPWQPVDPAPGWIIEGVGAITHRSMEAARHRGPVLAIGCAAPETFRRCRAVRRDRGFAQYWQMWARQEREHSRTVGQLAVDMGLWTTSWLEPVQPEDIHVSAVVMTNAAREVLSVRKEGTASYLIVGGKNEPGETSAQAAVREVAEEVGVRLDATKLEFLGRFSAPAANEPGQRVVSDAFVWPEPLAALPAVHAEIAHARWVDLGACGEDRTLAPLSRDVIFPYLAQWWGLEK